MLIIENEQIRVEVIDPNNHQGLIGSRYCTGGQIFQVVDKLKGNLLSGPTFAKSYNPFDAQGLPDAFDAYPNLGSAAMGDLVLAIGVGLIRYTSAIEHSFARENTHVEEPLDWKISQCESAVDFITTHAYEEWSYSLSRKITLNNRQISLVNTLENRGEAPLPISWFAHPFFPHTGDKIVATIPARYRLNRFYSLDENGRLKLNMPVNPEGILDTFIEGETEPENQGALICVEHDLVDNIKVDCRFPVARLPFWYNESTFSPEPYFIDELHTKQHKTLEIVYRF